MKPLKQLSRAEMGFLPKVGKKTRKAVFLAEMEQVVPWSHLEGLIEPFYPKKENGHPPMLLGTMLRIHCMQQWFGYSDLVMEEALYDVPLLRQFAGLEAFEHEMPDESMILRFRRLLEKHDLAVEIFAAVSTVLSEKSLLIKCETVVDTTLISAPSLTKSEDEKLSGQLDPKRSNNWLEQGDGFYVSARALRAQWYLQKRGVKHVPPYRWNTRKKSKIYGFPRSAALLLGYSVEMFLKAGLVKAYQKCSLEMFERDVKKFGHDYLRISRAIEFPEQKGDEDNFRLLKNFVTNTSRYPLFPASSSSNRFGEINKSNRNIWSKQKFSELLSLSQRCRDHIVNIDSDGNCIYKSNFFGKDGYVYIRSGGYLSPRIIFRYSKEMVAEGSNNIKTILEIIRSMLPSQIWNEATIIEDGDKKSIFHRGRREFAP